MKLIRGINRWDALALMLNATIGGGIYGLPSQVFAISGSYSLPAMLVCVVALSLIICCFAEVGSRFTGTGGPLLYADEAFGHFAGFMTGWLTLVLRIIGMAAIVNITISYLGFFVPFAQTTFGRSFFICLLIISLCYINLLGIKQSVLFNNIFTVGKIFTLVFFVTTGLFFIKSENFNFNAPVSFQSFSASVLLMVYAFSGFTGAITTGGEMKNPQKDIPFSLLAVQGFKAILYMLIQVVCIGTLSTLGQSEKPLTDAANSFLPGWGGILITIGALISFAATLNGAVLVTSRICYGMADKKLLPIFMGQVHHRFHTPHMSLLFTCGIMLILTLTNSLLFLLTVNALGTLLVYIISCAALIKLRKKAGIPAAAFVLPAGKAIAVFSILFCVMIMSGSTTKQLLYISCLLGAGVVVYSFLILSKRKMLSRAKTPD
ncbi:MAG: APC family permease [Chitinophagaceae bacterium]